MKHYVIIVALMSNFSFGEVGTAGIDRMIDSIKKPRPGLPLEGLSLELSPFKPHIIELNTTASITEKVQEKVFVLNAIMNHRAYIDGKWYKKDDEVADYVLRFIGTRGVVMTREQSVMKLFLNKKDQDIFTFKGER
jgi:hypothetical protein